MRQDYDPRPCSQDIGLNTLTTRLSSGATDRKSSRVFEYFSSE